MWICADSDGGAVDSFSIIDFIQGIIPYKLTSLLQSFGCSRSQTISFTVTAMFSLSLFLRENIWLPRCHETAEVEGLMNITKKLKKGKVRKSRLTSSNLNGPVVRKSRVTLVFVVRILIMSNGSFGT